MLLHCGSQTLDLATPRVMGILNVTPDSFADCGRFADHQRAIAHAAAMIADGADIIDVGGESTRPGAALVSVEAELQRVIPVIEAIRAAYPAILISIDTSKPEVMRVAVAAGAGLINDVRGLTEPGALAAAAQTQAAVCLMHMQGQPASMQAAPQYRHVVREVSEFLAIRVQACHSAGIARDRIVVDPGIGFGKTLVHNLDLLAHLPQLLAMQLPVLIGASRKRLIGELLGRPVEQRLMGSVALATASVLAGAHIIRAHDVAATCDAVRMAQALRQAGYAIN